MQLLRTTPPTDCPDTSIAAARRAFGVRLRAALRAGGKADGAAAVHEQLCRHGAGEVTVFAVRKWLAGEAIPTQATLRALADWLAVEPGWLRFGDDRGDLVVVGGDHHADLLMLATLRRLNADDIAVVAALVAQLLAQTGKSGRPRPAQFVQYLRHAASADYPDHPQLTNAD